MRLIPWNMDERWLDDWIRWDDEAQAWYGWVPCTTDDGAEDWIVYSDDRPLVLFEMIRYYERQRRNAARDRAYDEAAMELYPDA